MALSGIDAARLEHNGEGALIVAGRSVVFVRYDGASKAWECETESFAYEVLWTFRCAAAQSEDIH
jgi:hypothetical protein